MIKFTTAKVVAIISLYIIYLVLLFALRSIIHVHTLGVYLLLWGIFTSGYVLGIVVKSIMNSRS